MSNWKKHGSPYDPNHQGKNRLRPSADDRLEPVLMRTSDIWSSEWMRRAMEDSIHDLYRGAGSSAATPKGPPSSYTAARGAVEKWLSTAPDQSFDDIAGNDEALEQLRDAVRAPVEHAELYKAYGMKMPKGAVLFGPPGCGKTMFARAAASEMRKLYGDKVEFICLAGSEIQSGYVGVTQKSIKALFTFAREYKAYHGHPLLIFIDEADAILPDRTGRARRVAPWEENQVATFLAEMDGVHESGAFVLLATNRVNVIDQALLRDGRCDFKIEVKKPTIEAVEIILRKAFSNVLIAEGSVDEIVFAAVESLWDPNKVILDMEALGVDMAKLEISRAGHRHFLLEHIVSGAMAASIPARSIRYAFARDKADGVARGVTVADVIASVNDIFAENRGLDHAFALDDFKRDFLEDVKRERLGGEA